MFATIFDITVPAHELRASDRFSFDGDPYLITATSVPAPGLVKLWVEPIDPESHQIQNFLQETTVGRKTPFIRL